MSTQSALNLDLIGELIDGAKDIAVMHRALTGRPLGITC